MSKLERVIKFYSEGSDWSPGGSVADLLNRHKEFEEVTTPSTADLVVFNGGDDIGTSIYGEKPVMSGVPLEISRRDQREMALFDACIDQGVFMLGICRGAQLLNCLNGGSLWQHVDGHTSNHDMFEVKTGQILYTTSTHHQQMRAGKGAEIIAVANTSTVKHCDGLTKGFTKHGDRATGDDLEVVFYPKTRTLCIQGHPEYVPTSTFAQWCLDLILTKYNLKATLQELTNLSQEQERSDA